LSEFARLLASFAGLTGRFGRAGVVGVVVGVSGCGLVVITTVMRSPRGLLGLGPAGDPPSESLPARALH
jgi:hypothetical protein